jgi:hypothetical protein
MVLKQYAPVPIPMSPIQNAKTANRSDGKHRSLLDVDISDEEIGLIHWPLIAQVKLVVWIFINFDRPSPHSYFRLSGLS